MGRIRLSFLIIICLGLTTVCFSNASSKQVQVFTGKIEFENYGKKRVIIKLATYSRNLSTGWGCTGSKRKFKTGIITILNKDKVTEMVIPFKLAADPDSRLSYHHDLSRFYTNSAASFEKFKSFKLSEKGDLILKYGRREFTLKESTESISLSDYSLEFLDCLLINSPEIIKRSDFIFYSSFSFNGQKKIHGVEVSLNSSSIESYLNSQKTSINMRLNFPYEDLENSSMLKEHISDIISDLFAKYFAPYVLFHPQLNSIMLYKEGLDYPTYIVTFDISDKRVCIHTEESEKSLQVKYEQEEVRKAAEAMKLAELKELEQIEKRKWEVQFDQVKANLSYEERITLMKDSGYTFSFGDAGKFYQYIYYGMFEKANQDEYRRQYAERLFSEYIKELSVIDANYKIKPEYRKIIAKVSRLGNVEVNNVLEALLVLAYNDKKSERIERLKAESKLLSNQLEVNSPASDRLQENFYRYVMKQKPL